MISLNYKNYKQARDAAWRILIACKADRLPVSVSAVCARLYTPAHSYARSYDVLKLTGLDAITQETDGFCINLDGKYHIFYDDTLPVPRQRFTIAHEIGHIVLGHVPDGSRTRRNREISARDRPEETQANQFAARLLAPACVLHELKCFDAESIAKLCNISITAARFRAERIAALERRQNYYSSPLERTVCRNFSDYIKDYRLCRSLDD